MVEDKVDCCGECPHAECLGHMCLTLLLYLSLDDNHHSCRELLIVLT